MLDLSGTVFRHQQPPCQHDVISISSVHHVVKRGGGMNRLATRSIPTNSAFYSFSYPSNDNST